MTRTIQTLSRALTLTTGDAGTAEVTVTDRGAGHPFLLLHGGGGPQTVTAFAGLLASTRHARVITPTHPASAAPPGPTRWPASAGRPWCCGVRMT